MGTDRIGGDAPLALGHSASVPEFLLRLCHRAHGARRAFDPGLFALRMGSFARIGHFNIVKGVRVELHEHAGIGDFNWISGLSRRDARHFSMSPIAIRR